MGRWQDGAGFDALTDRFSSSKCPFVLSYDDSPGTFRLGCSSVSSHGIGWPHSTKKTMDFDFRATWYEVLMYSLGVRGGFIISLGPFISKTWSGGRWLMFQNKSLSFSGRQHLDILLLSGEDPKWMDPEEYLCYFGIWHGYCQKYEACAYLLDHFWQHLPLKSSRIEAPLSTSVFAVITGPAFSFHPVTGAHPGLETCRWPIL